MPGRMRTAAAACGGAAGFSGKPVPLAEIGWKPYLPARSGE